VYRLVAAEFAKLGTTGLWLWLVAGWMALTALYVGLTIVQRLPGHRGVAAAHPGRAADGVLPRRHPTSAGSAVLCSCPQQRSQS
jgi:hypothetical protein